jgi:K+-transporting ATPase ATPase C chain
MKSVKSYLILSLLTMLFFGALYPLAMVGAGQLMPERAAGLPLYRNEQLVGFENIGQPFSSPNYFWSRPSAVDYNAASTGGSNLGPTNPDFLALVQSRIDTLQAYHPGLQPAEIPVELVTASGSGLDPHISHEAALIQVNRIAQNRNLPEAEVRKLVATHTEAPLLGVLGPGERVNVLKLNLALDEMDGR